MLVDLLQVMVVFAILCLLASAAPALAIREAVETAGSSVKECHAIRSCGIFETVPVETMQRRHFSRDFFFESVWPAVSVARA